MHDPDFDGPGEEPVVLKRSELDQRIIDHVDKRGEAHLDRLRRLVDEPSGVDQPQGRVACVAQLERLYAILGFQTERLEGPGPLTHLVARRVASERPSAPRILLAAPLDTSFHASQGFVSLQREGELATGPGVLSAKGGIISSIAGLEALAHVRLLGEFDVVAFHPADSSVFFASSAGHIEALAADRELGIGLDGLGIGEQIAAGRKGARRLSIQVRGRSAHGGADGEYGIDALQVLLGVCAEAQRIAAAGKPGTQAHVGTVQAGTRPGVVPGDARAQLEVYGESDAEVDRVMTALERAVATLHGAQVALSAGPRLPAWVGDAASERLAHHVVRTAKAAGVDLEAATIGAPTVANLLAAAGLPTVDGLGPAGTGAHTTRETIRLWSITERAKLLAMSLLAWKRDIPVARA
jgi:glutamate carboxypeptidase